MDSGQDGQTDSRNTTESVHDTALERIRSVLYPNCYTWFVFFSALDIMITWIVLHRGGHEVNRIADWVIRLADLPGLVVFKFVLVVLVVCICEIVGRRRPRLGSQLAKGAVAISVLPVVAGMVQLLVAKYG